MALHVAGWQSEPQSPLDPILRDVARVYLLIAQGLNGDLGGGAVASGADAE